MSRTKQETAQFWPEGVEVQAQFIDAIREIIGLDPLARGGTGPKKQREKPAKQAIIG